MTTDVAPSLERLDTRRTGVQCTPERGRTTAAHHRFASIRGGVAAIALAVVGLGGVAAAGPTSDIRDAAGDRGAATRQGPDLGVKAASVEAANDEAPAGVTGPRAASAYQSGGTFLSVSSTTGWGFTPTVDVIVTDLGMFDQFSDGLIDQHDVGIFKIDGTPMVTGVVPSGLAAPLIGTSRYIGVAPTVLVAGQQYYIVSNNNQNDQVVFGPTAVTFDFIVTWDGFVTCATNQIDDPCQVLPGQPGNLGPNFRADPIQNVASAAAHEGGGTFLSVSSTTGWGFTPTTDLIVTELGIFDQFSNGLIDQHDVGIFEIDGTPVVTAFIPAGAQAVLRDDSRFVPISPVLLEAGRAYYIASNNNVNDQVVFGSSAVSFDPRVVWDGFLTCNTNEITDPCQVLAGQPGNFGPNFRARSAGNLADEGYRQTPCSAGVFLDISGTGTELPIASSSDDGGDIVNLPFMFPFDGGQYDTIGVSSNGYLIVGGEGPLGVFENQPIPSEAGPNGLIAPYWDDWSPNAGGNVVFQVIGPAGARQAIVQWTNVPHFSGSGTATFQVVLAEGTGDIFFRMAGLTPNSPSSGVEDMAGETGISVGIGSGGCLGLSPTCYREVRCDGGFVDISGTGTLAFLASNSDDGGDIVPMPFPFEFFGQPVPQIGISSNGYLSAGPDFALGAFQNMALPNPAAPLGLIAPYWDDWSPNVSGTVVHQTIGPVGSREFIVQWTQVPHFSGSGYATFQVALSEGTNEIAFRYSGLTPNSATIGMQDQQTVRAITLGQPQSGDCRRLRPRCSSPMVTCTGDLDGNGEVDFNDLLTVLGAFNAGPGGDTDGDGDTDFNDLLAVLSGFGPCM
jgi:hypothetical protein